MPEIPSIGHGLVGPINRATGTQVSPGTENVRQNSAPHVDRVELSRHAQLMDRVRQLPEVREELVEQIRQAIADGTYDTPEKLEAALEGLLEPTRAWKRIEPGPSRATSSC